MTTISAAMIVRNEAGRLAACLSTIAAVVDEIVVVDTGSTDGTLDIARRFTQAVHVFPWVDDFAAARNAALGHATGDYVLVVDADELVADPGEAAEALRHFARNRPDSCVGTVAIHNHFGAGENAQVHVDQVERFFRRGNFGYEGTIHEQITPLDGKKTSAPTGVHLLHHGYAQAPDHPEHKARRNIPLLEAEIGRHPEDEYFRFQLGKALFSIQQFQAAAAALEGALECIDFSKSPPSGRLGPVARSVLTDALATLAYALVNAGAPERAAAVLEAHRALNHAGTHRADFHHARGYVFLMLGRVSEAREAFETALSLGSSEEDVLGTGTFSAAYHVGLLREAEHRLLDALNAYLMALQFKGDHLPTLRRCVDLVVEKQLVLPREILAVCHVECLQSVFVDRTVACAKKGDVQGVYALVKVAASLGDDLERACRAAIDGGPPRE